MATCQHTNTSDCVSIVASTKACETHAFNVPFFVVPAVSEYQSESAKRDQEALPELIPTIARIVVKEQLDTATILQDQET